MKIGVVIPWREQPSRIPAFEAVVKWYKENLPEATIYYADRKGPVWSMSGSRNDGIREAEADGCHIVIVNDADTIPQLQALRAAIRGAASDDLIHNPYTEYRALTEESTYQYLEGLRNISQCQGQFVRGACSGVNVFKPSTWWSIGGNDEKFSGWGYEDTAMKRAHSIIKKEPYICHEGMVYSLSHKEQPREGKHFETNKRIYELYQRTSNAEAMLKLVASKLEDVSETDYGLFILGNGRKGYLDRTIASWEANLKVKPKVSYIFDDSGDQKYVNSLIKEYGDRFKVVPIAEESVGHVKAIQFIAETLKDSEVNYFLELEEDWMLFRSIDILEIIEVMQQNPNILQMRIPRTVWYSDYHILDINAGSLLNHHINIPGTRTEKKSNEDSSWYEWRGDFYFWSHNPNVFHKSILSKQYNSFTSNDHELEFGRKLLEKYPNGVCGWWAKNPYDGYITHIGIRDKDLLAQMPKLPQKLF
jgi:hypothetical protein